MDLNRPFHVFVPHQFLRADLFLQVRAYQKTSI
jgi:hypothetical protein